MSAGSTTSVFACGMSRPDSIIVVETSTSASPAGTASSGLSSPLPASGVGNQEAKLRHTPGASPAPLDRLDRFVAGRTIGARSRSRRALSDQLLVYSRRVSGIAWRPSRVSMIEMSRRPASDM